MSRRAAGCPRLSSLVPSCPPREVGSARQWETGEGPERGTARATALRRPVVPALVRGYVPLRERRERTGRPPEGLNISDA